MSKKRKSVRIWINPTGLNDYEYESLKEKFSSFAMSLSMLFDLDYISVSGPKEFNK